MYVSLPKNDVLCQFFGENGPNFNKHSTKLSDEALIGKKCKNKKVEGNLIQVWDMSISLMYVC